MADKWFAMRRDSLDLVSGGGGGGGGDAMLNGGNKVSAKNISGLLEECDWLSSWIT